MKNRSCISKNRSGGIALIVKEVILPYIKVHDTKSSDLILLFTLSKLFHRGGQFEDLTCGIVYIPPYGTKYASEDPFLEIQEHILKICSDNSNIILFGDFNSRTSNLPDYVQVDRYISDMHGLQELHEENINTLNNFEMYNVPLDRNTADKNTNTYGYNMLEFCKNNNLFILNGRIGTDYNSPKQTCKEKSTVDYFLSSSNNFDKIEDFQIHDFSSLFSDAHCPISLELNVQFHLQNRNKPVRKETHKKPVLWEPDKTETFIENFDVARAAEIEAKLDNLLATNNISKNDIDDLVTHIGSLYESCSKTTFGYKKVKQKDKYSKFKPWFNRSCINARNVYHKTRKMYNKYKSEYYKTILKTVSKNYKNTLNVHRHKFKAERIQKLRRLKTSDPREYWKIINSDKKTEETHATLDDLFNFYKDSNEHNNDSYDNDFIETLTIHDLQRLANDEININITAEEIVKAAKSLKNNKSPGLDNILNEHLKSTINLMCPLYVKLFNLILDTGIVPDSWTLGSIKPIFKNKGDPKDPNNYRPITLLSSFGKLFTTIINNRLHNFAEKYNIISDSQAGFRKNFSTSDNLFILKSLIDILQSKKKKFYCCFIDFKQAFDTVWRAGLWYKLTRAGITGKCFILIYNMYQNIKSKVTTNEGSSNFFNCNVGVRQGENLSPFLFSIFLNDLENFLHARSVSGVELDINTDDAYIYLKLLVLLYADDTVIFSDDKDNLQHALNVFEDYCKEWHLTVNTSKAKVVSFSRGRVSKNVFFLFQNTKLEMVNEYKYLGIFLGRSGSFVSAKKHIVEQANKAVFALLKKSRNLDLPVDIQIDLFNKTIKPILLYGSELWGMGNIEMIERVQLKFYKYIFNLKRSTPSNMIYGELGVLPLYIDIQTRIISFWTKLIENREMNKLSSTVYTLLLQMHNSNAVMSPWIKHVKDLLCSLGFPVVWYSQSFINSKWLIKAAQQRLKDIFIQNWSSRIYVESESNIYRIFKQNFEPSNYISILPTQMCKSFIAFRTRNHRLPVETGRWTGVPYRERLCRYCSHDIGDEFHTLLICPKFKEERIKYITPYYHRYPNTFKFQELMNGRNKSQLFNLCHLIRIIMEAAKKT